MIIAIASATTKASRIRKRCRGTRQPHSLEPVGDRVEEIGERHARDERQKNRGEHVNEKAENRRRDQPEPDLSAKIRGDQRLG